jgi:alkaline phosphatase D
VPTLAVWDDHDFGKNDGGGDFPQKALAQAMFNSFWNIPSTDPLRSRPGLYRSVTIGPAGQRVQIIMLDTRYFRDPLRPTDQRDAPGRERYIPHPPDAAYDVLSASQWAWLEKTLQEPAEFRIIASSIQVIADGHGYERWGQFPAALARLYRLVGTTGVRGVVFVSGDRHLAAINRRDDLVGYALYDLTASAINAGNWRQGMPTDLGEAGPYRLGPSYTRANYGRIGIDWMKRVLKLEVIGMAGQVALTAVVPFTSIGL